jgi:hypothetical protein
MSDPTNANQNEKAAKTRRKPERESVLSPTFAAARQATGNERSLPGRAVAELGQRQAGETSEELALASGEIDQAQLAGFDFSSIPAHTLTTSNQQLIQPHLTVNEPGDPYEQEADRVAEAVMRMPATPSLPAFKGLESFLNPTVNRGPAISRIQASGNSGAFQAPAHVETRINQMQGGGQPLPESEQEFFEQRLGYDFSGVRIHTDPNAVQASRDIQAHAFTIGHNIAFNEGAYQPGTTAGRRLLAHELTHVVQQGAAGVQRKPWLRPNPQSQVMRHLQSLQRSPNLEPELYRQEIAAFQQQHSTADIVAQQQQIMAVRDPIDIGQRDHSRSIRRCGGGGGGGAPGASASTFSSDSFSAGSGGPLTFSGGTFAKLSSPAYSPSGKVKVSGGTDAQAKDWEAGFIQTVLSYNAVGHYLGSPANTKFSWSTPGPRRDALVAGGEPWYDPNNTNGPGKVAFSKTDSSESVSLWDQPAVELYWDTPDAKGKLNHSDGKSTFALWMIARQKSAPNTIHYLNWATWEVDWSAQFNYASAGAKTAKKVTGELKVTGSGGGKGSATPVLSGTTANSDLKSKWS